VNNLIIFATYWNEIEWIRPSLNQIRALDPLEVIICDGCFDPRQPVPSTDGTREVIEAFVKERENARMISPIHKSLPSSLLRALKGHAKSNPQNILKVARWKGVYATLRSVAYRRNQSMTFNHMISISELWKPGRWFMAYDADQFYPAKMISQFADIVNQDSDYGLLTADEITFFEDFDHYTNEFEMRNYNNMPHRIFPNTSIIPTRGIILEEWPIKSLSPRGLISRELYINRVKAKHVGTYLHYKIASRSRFEEGYKVGNRQRPKTSKYNMRNFEGVHPPIVREYLESRKA